MERETTYYKISDLKALGWTDGLIQKHLGNPDKLVKNPIYASKAPMRLYLIERVNQITSSNDLSLTLQSNLEKRVQRSQSAIAAHDVKRHKILAWVDSLHIEIPKYDYPELIKLACYHYNDMQMSRSIERGKFNDFTAASTNAEASFLYRITHNFLRHQETSYDFLIIQMFGQVGKQAAYEALKDRMTTEINRTYPDLLSFLNSRDQAIMQRT